MHFRPRVALPSHTIVVDGENQRRSTTPRQKVRGDGMSSGGMCKLHACMYAGP